MHDCKAANGRCLKRLVKGTLHCRVPRYPPSCLHCFKETKCLYSVDEEQFLEKAGLMRTKVVLGNNGGSAAEGGSYAQWEEKRVPVEEIVGGRWCYPTSSTFPAQPTNPQSYVCWRCVQNWQVREIKNCSILY